MQVPTDQLQDLAVVVVAFAEANVGANVTIRCWRCYLQWVFNKHWRSKLVLLLVLNPDQTRNVQDVGLASLRLAWL